MTRLSVAMLRIILPILLWEGRAERRNASIPANRWKDTRSAILSWFGRRSPAPEQLGVVSPRP